MSVCRVYVFKETDEKIEEMAEILGLNKSEVIEIAVNYYYRRVVKA